MLYHIMANKNFHAPIHSGRSSLVFPTN